MFDSNEASIAARWFVFGVVALLLFLFTISLANA